VKFGSAVVPVHEGTVRGDTRFTVAYYAEGRRIRQTFSSADAAIGEAKAAASKIQKGLERVADLSVADRDTFRAAQSLLGDFACSAHLRAHINIAPPRSSADCWVRYRNGIERLMIKFHRHATSSSSTKSARVWARISILSRAMLGQGRRFLNS
jgi:hypothetical protein